MSTITHSRLIKLPRAGSRSAALLRTLLAGPGTFYQVCERAGIDIEPRGAEAALRELFEGLTVTGMAKLDGICYAITLRAQLALESAAAPAAGQVAAPHFRGVPAVMPVLVIRRTGVGKRA